MAQVIKLVPNGTLPADRVLAEAQQHGLESAVVLGWDKTGHMYINSSYEDGPNVLWLLEIARDALMRECRDS